MLRLSKIAVLLAAVAVSTLPASSASAAEWHTNGDKGLISTPGGAIRLLVTEGAFMLACTGTSVRGTLNGPTSSALPWVNAATVTPVITGCSVGGAGGYVLTCSTAELRVNSYLGGTTLATAGSGVTTGTAGIACRFSIGATTCSTLTGTVAIHYRNPNPISTGPGALTLTSVGQALAMDTVVACAGIPGGPVTLGSPGVGSTINDTTFLFDGPNAPYIFRTP